MGNGCKIDALQGNGVPQGVGVDFGYLNCGGRETLQGGVCADLLHRVIEGGGGAI